MSFSNGMPASPPEPTPGPPKVSFGEPRSLSPAVPIHGDAQSESNTIAASDENRELVDSTVTAPLTVQPLMPLPTVRLVIVAPVGKPSKSITHGCWAWATDIPGGNSAIAVAAPSMTAIPAIADDTCLIIVVSSLGDCLRSNFRN